jgi:hypothetical protein
VVLPCFKLKIWFSHKIKPSFMFLSDSRILNHEHPGAQLIRKTFSRNFPKSLNLDDELKYQWAYATSCTFYVLYQYYQYQLASVSPSMCPARAFFRWIEKMFVSYFLDRFWRGSTKYKITGTLWAACNKYKLKELEDHYFFQIKYAILDK